MMTTVSGTNVQMEMVSRPHLEEKCMMATVSLTHKCMMEMVSRAHLEEKQRYRGPKRIWQWSHELINLIFIWPTEVYPRKVYQETNIFRE
jgi:hypothetical protein